MYKDLIKILFKHKLRKTMCGVSPECFKTRRQYKLSPVWVVHVLIPVSAAQLCW